jgi:hypothetical protein
MLLTITLLLLSANHDQCDPAKEKSKSGAECHHPSSDPAAAATSNEAVLLRGEKLKGLPKTELAALLKTPADFDGKPVFLEAKVRKACERKGCWMELAPAAGKGPGVRVTFKDYGFFVPLDSAGRTAKVEGVVQVAELSEERAKHYESEGAVVPRGKDGKPREVQLVASGVELRK